MSSEVGQVPYWMIKTYMQSQPSQLVTLALWTVESFQLLSPSHMKCPLPNFRSYNPCKYSQERKRVDKSRDFYRECEFGLKENTIYPLPSKYGLGLPSRRNNNNNKKCVRVCVCVYTQLCAHNFFLPAAFSSLYPELLAKWVLLIFFN